MKLFLKYQEFPQALIDATERLMAARPSQYPPTLRDAELLAEREDTAESAERASNSFENLANEWAQAAVAAYDRLDGATVEVKWESGLFGDFDPEGTIRCSGLGYAVAINGTTYTLHVGVQSMIVLFRAFAAGILEIEGGDIDGDDVAWAYSLYYRTRPRQFRRMVRHGRITRVAPSDLYKATTLNNLYTYGINPGADDALRQLDRAMHLDPAPDDDNNDNDGDDNPVGGGQEAAESPSEATALPELPDTTSLRAMARDALRRLATSRGISGAWSMTKDQLLSAFGVAAS